MQNQANFDAEKYRDYYFNGSKGYFDEVFDGSYSNPSDFVDEDILNSL